MKTETIRCRALMVGDWITDNNGFQLQITNVGDDYAYATFEGNEADPWEFDDKDDQPQPIEITKELLGNNGWIKYGYLNSCYSYGFCTKDEDVYHLEWKLGTLSIMLSNGGVYPDIVIPVKYIHQLQQILRLVGLTELANNFKV